jgi:hypothetical protein
MPAKGFDICRRVAEQADLGQAPIFAYQLREGIVGNSQSGVVDVFASDNVGAIQGVPEHRAVIGFPQRGRRATVVKMEMENQSANRRAKIRRMAQRSFQRSQHIES